MQEIISASLRRARVVYEVARLAFIVRSFLPKSPVIVEAGAHNGSDTRWLSKLRANTTVHAFEPVPHLFTQLQDRTSKYKNVHCYNAALSDSSGLASMYISSGGSDASSSLHRPQEHLNVNPHVEFNQSIDVPTITLDQWALNHQISHVDFLWLDMQGHEQAAMQGGLNILRTVTAIYTEVSLQRLYAGTPLYDELRLWLDEQGFRVAREHINSMSSGDVFFTRKS